jgi:hypothetical protein
VYARNLNRLILNGLRYEISEERFFCGKGKFVKLCADRIKKASKYAIPFEMAYLEAFLIQN